MTDDEHVELVLPTGKRVWFPIVELEPGMSRDEILACAETIASLNLLQARRELSEPGSRQTAAPTRPSGLSSPSAPRAIFEGGSREGRSNWPTLNEIETEQQ
jgi:hypothetical protein